MANAANQTNGKMTLKEKLMLAELAQKFNVGGTKKADADGNEKDYYEITAKAEGANLVAFVDEAGEYEIFPTTTEAPLNIAVLGDMTRYCKLLAK